MKIIEKSSRTKFHSMALGLAVGWTSLTSSVHADTTNAAPPGPEVTGRFKDKSFWTRFDRAWREESAQPAFEYPPGTAPGAPPPPQANRRGNPTPGDSPPYPTGEWQIGGTEIIGDQNLTPDYTLMQAVYDGPHGQFWRDNKIKLYGWEDFSGIISSSPKQGLNPVNASAANFPEAYDQRSDRLEQNQFVLYLERTPDENQTDHADWGFRLSQVYGLDYRYMISRGWGDHQLTQRNDFYGTDNPMMYFNLYIPNIAQGLNLTLGRIISEADIEAQLAPNNLMSSHSILYTFDPYCQWGLFGTLKLNNNWILQFGMSAGNDVTPWETQDPGTQPTATAMFQYQSSNNKFSFYGGGNAINNTHWGFNNIQQYVGTFTYKFNEKIWMSHETWWMCQSECPGQATVANPGGVTATDEPPNENGGNGYTDGQIPIKPGWSAEWATLNYTMFRLGPSTFFTVRNEMFDDEDGQRTGYATLYSEHSVGLTWWPNKLITVRPELRYERTYGTHGPSGNQEVLNANYGVPGANNSANPYIDEAKPYDNGTRRQQVSIQCDVIYHF
jgi:hypothetical protein